MPGACWRVARRAAECRGSRDEAPRLTRPARCYACYAGDPLEIYTRERGYVSVVSDRDALSRVTSVTPPWRRAPATFAAKLASRAGRRRPRGTCSAGPPYQPRRDFPSWCKEWWSAFSTRFWFLRRARQRDGASPCREPACDERVAPAAVHGWIRHRPRDNLIAWLISPTPSVVLHAIPPRSRPFGYSPARAIFGRDCWPLRCCGPGVLRPSFLR